VEKKNPQTSRGMPVLAFRSPQGAIWGVGGGLGPSATINGQQRASYTKYYHLVNATSTVAIAGEPFSKVNDPISPISPISMKGRKADD